MTSDHSGASRVSSGSRELDLVLGGGFFPGSLVVIAGAPGSGKTILAQQMCFANVRAGSKAVYYTTLSESHGKLLQHLGGFAFFDRSLLEERVEFLHVGDLLDPEQRSLDQVAAEVLRKAYSERPGIIVVDSSKALHDYADPRRLRGIFYDLASRVGHTDAVLVLVGEYTPDEIATQPEFAVADAIIRLTNDPEKHLDRRWLRVLKMRGSRYIEGRHSFRIDESGVLVFPRLETLVPPSRSVAHGRVSMGVAGLDRMTDGGIPTLDSTLVIGPSGVGKTMLCLHYVTAGLEAGERCFFVSLQETWDQLSAKATAFGWDLESARQSGALEFLHIPPVEVNLDEVGGRIVRAIEGSHHDRVVIDSLTELVVSRETERLAPYAWALSGLVREAGASLLVTDEEVGTPLSPGGGSADVRVFFDNVLTLRYAGGAEISREVGVFKMRRSGHSKQRVGYRIGAAGVELDPSSSSAER